MHHQEEVRVTSRRAPAIGWFCPPCHGRRPFDCSEKFRANSNAKLVDIWLIYRCRECDRTKNITIVERMPVRRVPAPLLTAAEANDGATARALARDVAIIRRNKAEIVEGDAWELLRAPALPAPSCVVLSCDEPLLLRLDAVIAAVLGTSRGDIRARHATGHLEVTPAAKIDTLRLWPGAVVRAAPGGAN